MLTYARANLRTPSSIEADGVEYQWLESHRKDNTSIKGRTPGAQCNSITKGPPLLNLGPAYTVPAPVHNNPGVTGDLCNDLLVMYKDLDSKHHAMEPSPQRTGTTRVCGRVGGLCTAIATRGGTLADLLMMPLLCTSKDPHTISQSFASSAPLLPPQHLRKE